MTIFTTAAILCIKDKYNVMDVDIMDFKSLIKALNKTIRFLKSSYTDDNNVETDFYICLHYLQIAKSAYSVSFYTSGDSSDMFNLEKIVKELEELLSELIIKCSELCIFIKFEDC